MRSLKRDVRTNCISIEYYHYKNVLMPQELHWELLQYVFFGTHSMVLISTVFAVGSDKPVLMWYKTEDLV